MPLIKNVRARELVQGAVVMNLGDVREEADRILADARAEADRIVAEARAEAVRLTDGAAERGHAEGLARGETEGRATGLEQGVAEGAAAAEAAVAERLGAISEGWTTALEQFVQSREVLREEARRDLLRLGLAIAERVLGRLPAHDATVVVEQVDAAIAMLAGATRLRIRIHPDDLEAVERHFAATAGAIRDAPELDVVFDTDESIVPGGCVVAAGDGEVDSRLDVQISRIVHGVFPELLEAPPAAEPPATPSTTPPATPAAPPVTSAGPETVSDAAPPAAGDAIDDPPSSVEDIARDLEALGFDDLEDPTPGATDDAAQPDEDDRDDPEVSS